MMRSVIVALSLVVALPVLAQDPIKQELVNDPAVRKSLGPEINAQGRNEPQQHQEKAEANLQQLIDQAHNGSTGITSAKGTRQKPGLPTELQDGNAPRVIEQPEK